LLAPLRRAYDAIKRTRERIDLKLGHRPLW